MKPTTFRKTTIMIMDETTKRLFKPADHDEGWIAFKLFPGEGISAHSIDFLENVDEETESKVLDVDFVKTNFDDIFNEIAGVAEAEDEDEAEERLSLAIKFFSSLEKYLRLVPEADEFGKRDVIAHAHSLLETVRDMAFAKFKVIA